MYDETALRRILLLLWLLASTANCVARPAAAGESPQAVSGDEPAGRTSTQPVSSQPTSPPPAAGATVRPPTSGDPTVDSILDRLEIKGKAIKGLSCDLVYTYVTVEPVEDTQVKEGRLLFARGEPNARFLVHFTKMIAGGLIRRSGEYYLFDGQWLTERNDKAKTVIRRQIARSGERKDPFELGKGPFPLPFGQKREDILRQFRVTSQAFTLGDPPGSLHLHCVPRPKTAMSEKYSRVEIYVDRRLDLPIRIVSERLSDGNRIEVDFKGIDTNDAPAGSRFTIGRVPEDFTTTVEPLPPRSGGEQSRRNE